MLKNHEGLILKPYVDTVGKLTIGYGRNLEDVGISIAEAEGMLDRDIEDARRRCEQIFGWFGIIDAVRQDVIVMMTFNMGINKVCHFHQMIEAIKIGDWVKAADEMLDSAWARQVGARAMVLSRMMKLGRYPDSDVKNDPGAGT
jgi:lysozyme